MANENLKKMLEMSKKLEQTGSQPSTFPKNTPRTNKVSLDKQIEMLDEQVFGAYKKPEGEYDPRDEMQRLKERYNGNTQIPDLSHSKLPRNIIESILSNPCNLEPVEDPKMTALQERINGKMPGIKSVIEVQKKLDEHDKVQMELQESLRPKPQMTENVNSGVIDYSLIKMIVENVINEKLGVLNENINHGSSDGSMKVMTFDGNKFRFLDSQDNIYECEMKYVGKKKKKTS